MKKKKISILHFVRFILFIILTNIAGNGFSTDIEGFKPEIGVCTSLVNAEMLSTHGFSYVEESVGGFLMPLKSEEEFNEKLEQALQLPIPIRACNSFIPGNLKSVGPDAVHDEILQYVETAFRRAQLAGIEVIVFGSGGSRRIPDGFSRDEARRQFIELGKAIGTVAARYNIVVALEPLNISEVNFINSVIEGGEIVEEIGHPNFMLLADIYHMMKENEGPESILKYGHLLKHVHVAELEGRAAPGTHNQDLSSYYDALKQIDYLGRISIEGKWENMELQAPKAIETIRQQL